MIDLLNRLPDGTIYWGGMAEGVGAAFIGACLAVPEAQTHQVEVYNLQLRWDRQAELGEDDDTPEYGERWRAWLFEEIELLWKTNELPVLIDLDGGPELCVTQGGVVLCQMRDHREYEENAPQWVAPE